jgi:hypothetical protein
MIEETDELSLDMEKRAILILGRECLKNDELVAQFNRLSGSTLLCSEKRTPIEKMIDSACGLDGEKESDWQKWAEFVIECVWLRLPEETRNEFRIQAFTELVREEMSSDPDWQELPDGRWELTEEAKAKALLTQQEQPK